MQRLSNDNLCFFIIIYNYSNFISYQSRNA